MEFEKQITTVRHERHPSDSYDTPPEIAIWAVDKCLEMSEKFCGKVPMKDLTMLEPGCGDTAPFSTHAASLGIDSYGTDARLMQDSTWTRKPNQKIFRQHDFFDPSDAPKVWGEKFDIIATNPPFKFGQRFIEDSLEMLTPRGIACFLMKMSFLGTQDRGLWIGKNSPTEIHILSQRPSFAHGGTDKGQEYCLLFWLGTEISKKVSRNRGRVPRLYWIPPLTEPKSGWKKKYQNSNGQQCNILEMWADKRKR